MKVIPTLAALSATTFFAATGMAQSTVPGATYAEGGAVQATYHADGAKGRLLQTAGIRASELIGLNVQDRQGKSIGEIKDLVMNAETGKIAYAALSVGGLLGIGDEMFAVPFDAFTIRATDKDADPAATAGQSVANDLGDYVAVIDASAETFKNAQGFNQDDWPDMASKTWRDENDKAYQQARQARMATPEYAAHADLHKQNLAEDRQQLKSYATYRASEINGVNFDVQGADEQAEVEDVVVDSRTGKVDYVAVNFDDKMYAVPSKAIQVQKDADEDVTVHFTANKSWFDSAKSFDEEHWPATAASNQLSSARSVSTR